MRMLQQGQFFERGALLKALEHYRGIVWQNQEFLDAKMDYFVMLGSNAGSQYKTGEAVYYFEKLEELRKEHNMKGKHQFVAMQKCYLYTNSGQYEKAIQEYEQQKAALDILTRRITSGQSEDKMEVFTVLSILKEAGFSYSKVGDTSGLEALKVYKDLLIDNLLSQKQFIIGVREKLNIQFVKYSIDYFYYRGLLKDKSNTCSTLYQLYQVVNDNALGKYKNPGLAASCESWLTDYYIFMQPNADSARFYLERYKSSSPAILSSEKQLKTSIYDFQIWVLETQNFEVLPILESILNSKDSIYNLLAMELNQNLYAQTRAEYTALELSRVEEDKKKLTFLIWNGVILTLLLTTIVYVRIKSRSRKVKIQIDLMNNMADLRIAALEEEKYQAIKDEKEKMAQELHDDFSGRVAGAKHHIERLLQCPDSKDAQTTLLTIQDQLQDLYNASRDKSHQWFYDTRLQQQVSFRDSVAFIVDSALPDSGYAKNIQLDADVVFVLSFTQRIHILRILQEGMVNIMKHSNANEVNVFLYKQRQEIVFEISDNGNTKKGKKREGIGLQSIKKRVEDMNGRLKIENEEGYLLTIIFPLR